MTTSLVVYERLENKTQRLLDVKHEHKQTKENSRGETFYSMEHSTVDLEGQHIKAAGEGRDEG